MGILAPNLRPDLDALRVDVAVAALRDVVKDGWSVLGLSAGMVDAFVDQTGISSLGGATYDGAGKSISNAGSIFGGILTFNTNGNAGYTYADIDHPLSNGAVVKKIGSYENAAKTVVYKVVKRNSAGNYDVVVSQPYAHGGTGWEDVTLSSPYTVPGPGSYFLAKYCAVAQSYATTQGNVASSNSDVTGAGKAMAEAGSLFYPPLRAILDNVGVTTVSAPFALGFQPAQARVVMPVELGGGVIGTDCLLDLSRDGATWAAVPLSDLGKFDASTRIVGGLVNLAGQPAGSSIYWRWRTSANYTLRNHGIWLQCK